MSYNELKLSPENFHQEIKAGMERSAMTGCAHRSSTVMTPEHRLHFGFDFSLSESIKILGFILSGESLHKTILMRESKKRVAREVWDFRLVRSWWIVADL